MRHVLHVDSDPAIRDVVAQTLDSTRYAVRGLASLFEARAALQVPPPPDLVILDLSTGLDRSGELIRQIKANWPSLPVVAMTALLEPEFEAKARAAGADGVLRKPFTLGSLTALVGRLAP